MTVNINTTVRQAYDVVVVGGGIAGVSAAVAAGRAGCKVLLLEKGVSLGGLATSGLISWYEPLCDGTGKQMIGGIAEELLHLAVSVGFDNLPSRWGGEGNPERKNDRYSTFFSPTFFSLALDSYVCGAGVDILFDTRVTYPVMEGKCCRGVLVENVDGREFFPAEVVIDSTGDATVAFRAGIPCEIGENYLTYVAHGYDIQSISQCAEDKNLTRFRKWINCGSSFSGKGHPAGMPCFHGDNADELTRFVLTGRELLRNKYEGSDRKTRDLMMLPSMPQFRKIRHIIGKTVFDGTEEGVVCADSIGSAGNFKQSGKRYTIPYSTLYHPDYPNILTAGRIISAVGEGWEITRVIPVCALTGQAAGVAAALAVRRKVPVNLIPYAELYKDLLSNGVIFETMDKS